MMNLLKDELTRNLFSAFSQFLCANREKFVSPGMFNEQEVVLPDFLTAETRMWWRTQLLNFTLSNGMLSSTLGALGGVALTRNSPYFDEVECGAEEFQYVPSDIR